MTPLVLFSATHSLEAADYSRLRAIMDHGGSGTFNCAYKGKKASKPCEVVVRSEPVTHPSFVAFAGRPERTNVVTIHWPDGDTSRYTEVDSGEMLNLQDPEPLGYKLAGTEIEQDWSRGFVIQANGREHVRLW